MEGRPAGLGGHGQFASRSGKRAQSPPYSANVSGVYFLNPHVYLDTMVLLGSLSMPYPGHLQWAFALGACAASLCWFLALGYGARLLQPVFRQSFAWRVLDACIAFFMWALCALLLLRPL